MISSLEFQARPYEFFPMVHHETLQMRNVLQINPEHWMEEQIEG